MSNSITITEIELQELYQFMEEANEIFHQPMNFNDSLLVESFAAKNYPIIRKYYYDVLWEKLPQKMKDKILDE